MPSNNVIELVIKAVDQFSAPLRGIIGRIGGLRTAIAGLGLGLFFNKIIKESAEAQRTTAQLDAAYKATGATLGLTRERLDELALSLKRTTTEGGNTIRSAQAILLTFHRVRGQAFERTLKVAADLSARLGIDMASAARSVGAALQDPERGLYRLRIAGVQFTEEQRRMVRQMVELGQVSKAQDLILTELETRFKGAAQAARNTLGGALQALKGAIGGLFQQTKEDSADFILAINELTDAINDPEFKQSIQALAGTLLEVLTLIGKVIKGAGEVIDKLQFITHTGGDQIQDLEADLRLSKFIRNAAESLGLDFIAKREQERILKTVEALNRLQKQGLAPSGLEGRGRVFKPPPLDDLVPPEIEEVRVTATKITESFTTQFNRELEEQTQTSVERALAQWAKFGAAVTEQMFNGLDMTTATERLVEGFESIFVGVRIRTQHQLDLIKQALQQLVDDVAITAEQAADIFNRIIEENLPEVKVTVRKIDETPLKEISAAGIRMAENIQDALARAFEFSEDGVRGFLRTMLEALRTIVANALALDFSRLLGLDKLAQGRTASGGLGGIVSGVFKALFGAAGGGWHQGAVRVGEEGPETLFLPPGSKVVNQRQAASMGGGGNVAINMKNEINIQGGADAQAQAALVAHLRVRDERLKRDIFDALRDNGFGRLRAS